MPEMREPGCDNDTVSPTPAQQARAAAIAAEILTLLHDVYGYAGAAPLDIKTE